MTVLTDAFFTVLKMSGYGLVTAVVLLAVWLLLSRTRASRTALLALWLAVGFRLVCPWSPPSPLSLFNWYPADAHARGAVSRLEEAWAGNSRIAFRFTDGSSQTEYDRAVAAGVRPVLNPRTGLQEVHYHQDSAGNITPAKTFREAYGPTLAVVWLAGAAGLLGYGGVSYLLLKRKLRFAVRDEELPGVWYSDRIPSPCVAGLAAPQIYLTFGMSEEETRYVLAHERQHIQNRDHLWKALGWLILCLHWFNPLVWLLYRAFLRTVEDACDQRALRELGEERKADYGQALLSLSTGRRLRPGFSPLAFGEGETKGRVKTVLRYKKPLMWCTALAVVLCAAAGLSVLTGASTLVSAQREIGAAGLAQAGETVSFWFSPHGGWSPHIIKRSPPFPFQFDAVDGCDRIEVSCENSEVWSVQDVKCTGTAIWCKEFTATLPCTVNWCPIPGGDYRGRFGGTVTHDVVRFSLYAGDETVLRGVFLIQAGELDANGGGPFTATAYLSNISNFRFTANPGSSGALIRGAPERETGGNQDWRG